MSHSKNRCVLSQRGSLVNFIVVLLKISVQQSKLHLRQQRKT